MIQKILIANRGEISSRVSRTCRTLGIRSVAVYSEGDAGLPFVGHADQAVCIGPAAVADSYLNAEAILRAAAATGVFAYWTSASLSFASSTSCCGMEARGAA